MAFLFEVPKMYTMQLLLYDIDIYSIMRENGSISNKGIE